MLAGENMPIYLSNIVFSFFAVYCFVFILVFFAVVLNITKFFYVNSIFKKYYTLYFYFFCIFTFMNIFFCLPTFFHIFSSKENYNSYMGNFYETIYQYVYEDTINKDED